MADNVIVNSPTSVGATIATEDVGGVQHQKVIIETSSSDGEATPVNAVNPLPVTASSLPLPTDAATSALQTTGNTSLSTIAGAVAGTEMQVDVITMPTTTVQATNLDIRDLTFASDKVDASGTVLGAGTNNIGDVDVLSLPSIPAGNNNIGDVDIASGTLTAVTTITNPVTVVGAAADGAAVSGNPVRIGGKDGSGNTQDILTDTTGRLTPLIGFVSTANSRANANLGGGATAAGTFEDITQFTGFSLGVLDAGANGGTMTINWSEDGVNIRDTDTFAVATANGQQVVFGRKWQYFQYSYLHGAGAGNVVVQTILHTTNIIPSTHFGSDTITTAQDGQLVVAANRLLNGSNFINQAGDASGNAQVVGDLAHDAIDAGNPVKIGGKVSTAIPTTVANADRVDAWFDQWGRQVVSDMDVELGNTIGSTSLRDRIMAQRMTVLADSLADGLAGFWTSSTANGGTATSTGGEGVIQTSASGTGSAQITSTTVAYFPGQVGWFNSAVRFNDTGSAGNTRRIGVFTVSGTTPQDGFYYELSGTTLNAVVCKGGTPTAVASGSWSRAAVAPFTLDTNYHSFEIRYTANSVLFYVDNTLRNVISGTTAAITNTLNFPITIQSINTTGATNRLIAVRNCGIGRFGNPEQTVNETGLSAVWSIAVGGGTPHDSVDSGNPLKIGGKASAAPPSAVADNDRVNAWFTPTGTLNVTATPSTGGGWSTFMATSADGSTALTNSAQAIKGSAGTFGGYYIYNPNSVAIYVSIYNVAAASVTVGTTNPQNSFCIPPLAAANLEITNGINFSTAMSCAATTTGGGNTAPTTALEANFWYK